MQKKEWEQKSRNRYVFGILLIIALCITIPGAIRYQMDFQSDKGSIDILANDIWAQSWDIKKRDQIRWKISASDTINLYIASEKVYNVAIRGGMFVPSRSIPWILEHSGRHTVEFDGTWVLFLYNEHSYTVHVNYEIGIKDITIFQTIGLILAPFLTIVAIIYGVLIIYGRKLYNSG